MVIYYIFIPMNISGLPTDGAKAYYLFEALFLKGKPCLCILNDDEDIDIFTDNLSAIGSWLKVSPGILPFPQENSKRISTIFSLVNSDAKTPFFLLSSAAAVSRGTVSPANFSVLCLKTGDILPREKIIDFLANTGYTREDFVSDICQFSVRGEIIDIWPPQSAWPCRVVFMDNEIEQLREFDVETQRSKNIITKCSILPASEKMDASENAHSLKEFLPADTVIFIDENIAQETLPAWIKDFPAIELEPLSGTSLDFFPNTSCRGNINLFLGQLKELRKDGFQTTVFCANLGEEERLLEILEENKAEPPAFFIAPLTQGFYNPQMKLALITYNEIFGRYDRPARLPKFKTGKPLDALWEITAGDYVVHEKRGIGKYRGLKPINTGENISEYLFLEYRGGDKLFVPLNDFHKVQKYIGVEGRRPRLYSLDNISWEHAKERAKKSASDIAKHLYDLYTARKSLPGHMFPADNEFEKVLADSFIYNETPDQARAIEEVKKDMESPHPMDRVVLGDVGFGKTEVALRAAFKATLDARQAGLVAPTTVLAEQHYNVFTERLKSFPVKIALMTRFQTKKEQKETLDALKKGLVDIVIGTHRLIQKDVVFKDLGLLIVDEEHRFGVKQKEHIKMMKKNVDVLSLTATPIPRTLSMSLSGIKDLSVIESPPEGRLPVDTYIGTHDDGVIKKAILAELNRSGQVFYVHNYIHSIYARKNYLEKLVPGARVAILHGKMHSSEIEKTMWEFTRKMYDCLVATTIIEAGIDLPNVNTMIIEQAEEFGLSQLYQLRGRIGRSRTKAYCYLFYSKGELTEDAKKRLQALNEFMKLGSGFKLALRDMEIRGAGEILGDKQHGFVQDVGLDMYCKFISDEMSSLRGETPDARGTNSLQGAQSAQSAKEARFPVIDLNMSAFIPGDYITQDDIRISYYRRFMAVENRAELDIMLTELVDRFGKPPGPLANLVDVIELRLALKKLDICLLKEQNKYIDVHFYENNIPPETVDRLYKNYGAIIEFCAFGFKIKKKAAIADGRPVIGFLKEFFEELQIR
ncbi:MAG: transcription-repair coupling factor [Elusimicrobia bacterium RIFOXYB2_FULL_48_7]|nr:MAG: transcription-repair coupling factor [Elusimicrobia bacterium RIFOXYB2_FULL_48_7]